MFKSIHSKILSGQLFIVFIATFSLGIASFLIITSHLKNTEKEQCEYIARTWAKNMERLISEGKEQISLIAQSKAVEFYSSSFRVGPLKQYLSSFADKFPLLAYINAEGIEEIKLISGKIVPGGQKTSVKIQKAIENPNLPVFRVITSTLPNEIKNQNLTPPYMEFTISSEIFGEFAGIIAAQIPLFSTNPDVETFISFHFAESGFLTLYDSEGTTIIHANPERILTTVSLPPGLNDLTSTSASILFQRDTQHGVDGFTAYAPVAGSNLIVAANLPYDQFMGVPNKMKNLFFAIIAIVVLVCLLLSTTIARGISKPILKLTHLAQQLAKGEWEQQIQIDTADETAALGRSFKKMSDDFYTMIKTRDSEIDLRKKVEQAIKSSHLELDQIFNTAAGGMVVVTLDHEVIRVNDTFLQMMGLQRQDVINRYCHEVFPDHTCGTEMCVLTRTIQNNARVEIQVEKKRSDGNKIICNLVATPFLDIHGKLIGIIEDFRDITITKRTEELVKMSEKRYRLLFNSAPDGIAVLNNQGVIIDCNKSLASIYRRPRPELIGRHFTHFNTPQSAQNCRLNFKKIQDIDQAEGEVEVKTPDGTIVTLWRKGTTIRDAKGYFNGILLYDRDISKQKEIEELQEDMARIARHDLKSPLNGIINLPLLIQQEGNLSDKQIKRLKLIEDAGYKMLAMVNSSMDLYKMEEGTYSYSPVPVNLCPLLNKINEELWAEMQANQCSVKIFLNAAPVVDDKYSFMVQGEELLCYSMLANLIRNAVESNPRAKSISIYLDNTKQPEIQIHNHGQVPSSIQDKFFQKYATAGKEKGTGLGTYSARLMARTMNGDISMTSNPSSGTIVTITMPSPSEGPGPEKASNDITRAATKTNPKRPEKITPESLCEGGTANRTTGKRILLAEDDPISQALAKELLLSEGFLVIQATNGREALDLFKKSRFDLVLMDMQMPLLNGIETTRLIRKDEKTTGNKVPIVAVTGMIDAKNSQVFYTAGVNAIVEKPIQIDILKETITRVLTDNPIQITRK